MIRRASDVLMLKIQNGLTNAENLIPSQVVVNWNQHNKVLREYWMEGYTIFPNF